MVTARGKKRGGVAHAGSHGKAEDIAVEAERAFQVGYLEVKVADPGLRMDKLHGGSDSIR